MKKIKVHQSMAALILAILTVIIIIAGLLYLTDFSKEETQIRQLQKITNQNEFLAMIHLNLFQIPVYPEQETAKVKENGVRTIVKLDFDTNHGCGVIWDIKENEIIIVTTKHLLSIANTMKVTFFNQVSVQGEVIWISDSKDVGFIKVSMVPELLETMTEYYSVRYPEVEEISAGDGIMQFGFFDETGDYIYDGIIANPLEYIETFQTEMIHTYCYAKPGMSGGGLFNQRGYFLGIINGGADDNNSACLPVAVIQNEYKEFERTNKK